MCMNKIYYTPKIEEFYVGFRFERKPIHYNIAGDTDIKEWRKCTFNKQEEGRSNFYATFIDYTFRIEGKEIRTRGMDMSEFRVKVLDIDDIEELDWQFYREIDNGHTLEFIHPQANLETGRTLRVPKNIWEGTISIGEGYGEFFGETYEVRNYNELKKVMEFINII